MGKKRKKKLRCPKYKNNYHNNDKISQMKFLKLIIPERTVVRHNNSI